MVSRGWDRQAAAGTLKASHDACLKGRPLAADTVYGRGTGETEPMTDMTKTKKTVLVVDDDAAVRQLAARVLARCGYDVVEAVDGPSALAAGRKADRPIALLLSDVVLPGMNGLELARALRDASPGMRVVFMSGFEEDELSGMGIDELGAGYITKPFSADVLTLMIQGALIP